MTRDRVAAPDFGKNRTEICESRLEQLGCNKKSRELLEAPKVAIGAVKLPVTAEVASSSLVVPAILNKDFTLTSIKPARVQKDTNLHPFVSL